MELFNFSADPTENHIETCPCSECNGEGKIWNSFDNKKNRHCLICHGSGEIEIENPDIEKNTEEEIPPLFDAHCPHCSGLGTYSNGFIIQDCHHCKGIGLIHSESEIEKIRKKMRGEKELDPEPEQTQDDDLEQFRFHQEPESPEQIIRDAMGVPDDPLDSDPDF